MKEKYVLLFSCMMLLVLISGCTQNNTEEARTVNLNLKWLHQAQFAGFYAAEHLNYYDESNIEVIIIEGGVDNPAIQNVLSGKADIGVAGADDLIVNINEGHPLKAIAVIYKLSPVVYFSLEESNITTPYDFINKTIGVKKGTGTDYSYIAMLGNLDINRSQIIEKNVAYDLSSFYNGSIDVWPGFRINEPHIAELNGYNVSLILPEDWGVKIYADVLFSTESFIENNTEVVKNFVQDTLDGWQYAIENIDDAVDTTMDYVKNTSSKDHQLYMLQESVPLIHTGDSKIGMMDDDSWNAVISVLMVNNIIDHSPTVSEIYTNQFVS